MFKSILVPLDGSRLAEASLPVANFFARALGATVTLLHVIERDAPVEIHGERHLRTPEDAHQYLNEIAGREFEAGFGVNNYIQEAEASDIPASITGYSLKIGADLIVMCTHGRGGLRHLISGSNAQQVIGCGCIVVLQVRPDHEQVPYICNEILTPLDGNPEHENGLAVTTELAKKIGAKLHILVVIRTLGSLQGERAAVARLSPGAFSAMLDLKQEEALGYLESKLKILREEGLSASGGVERGDPARVILETTEKRKSDLVVLGTHRKAGTDAFWSGSVGAKVANNLMLPVLLVPVR